MFRLYRAGIIADLLKYTLVTGYRLVFLGDILDRGEYALEIILFICNLMYANNTEHELKVILNRGNHEELDQSTNDGFFDEIKKKFKFYNDGTLRNIYNTLKEAKNNSDEELSTIAKNFAIRNLTHETLKEAKNKSDEELKAEALDVAIDHYIKYSPNSIFKNFHEMINYMPSAIILQNESGQKFWLSHGGVPFNNKGEAIKFEILEKDNNAIEFVSDNMVAEQIRWNDFDNITGLQFNSIRNIGNIIGPDKAKEFMKLNNIHFIIRGHQDNPDNSFLLSNVDRYILGGVNNLGNEKIVRNMSAKTNERDRNVIFGPIYRIDLTENWNDGITVFDMNKNEHQVYPVITLSTNTDLGRNLVHDSFGILRFDLPKEKLDDFSKETNIIDTRKDMKTISGFTTQSV